MEPNGKHYDADLPPVGGFPEEPSDTAPEESPVEETPVEINSHRHQLWASLKALRPEIDRLAAGHLEPNERGAQLVVLLARIVGAEMDFRLKDEEDGIES